MNGKQIVFTAANRAELLEVKLPEVAEHEVMVQTVISTISAGTERANLTGDPNVSPNGASQVLFPRSSGYNSAGIVVRTGSAVTGVKPGDRVVVYWGKHQNYNVVPEEQAVLLEGGGLPQPLSFETGALSFISTFPMAAIRKTRLEMGESALVMGLGVLGLIAVKLLRAAGAAPVIAADPNPRRRELALKYGADYAFDPLREDFARQVKAVSGGGVNAAIEVTGVGAGFNEALDCMARFGRVALLGCTRSSDFTVDYYKKIHGPGITVIGAHTIARPSVESHPGWFTHLEELVEETHSPEECEAVYERLAFDRDFPIAVQFDWRKLK